MTKRSSDFFDDLHRRIKLGDIKVNKKSNHILRFWKKVNKDGPVHPELGRCWVWTGLTVSGYGRFKIGQTAIKVHRYSYREHNGPLKAGIHVLHKCDNPLCVNPDHLFVGGNKENVADMVFKGRQAKGVQKYNAKLTDEMIREIRRRYKPRCKSNGMTTMALEFGVSTRTIISVAKGETWRHI